MKFFHVASKLLYEPWFIRPSKHAELLQRLRARVQTGSTRLDTDGAPIDPDDDDCPALNARSGVQSGYGLAVIPVYGIIGKRLSWMELMCGGCDLDVVAEQITEADEDGDVHTIILDFDSPGGLYTGLPECADLIRTVARHKTVISFTDTQCCSAAYWLACNAGEFYCTRSACVGSINGFIAGIDSSEEWAKIGWTLELFRGKTGDLKAIGMDGKKWEEQEREFLQAQAQKGVDEFFATVRRGRGAVADDTMRGQWFDGDQALAANLVDGNVANLQEVIDAALATHYLAAAGVL